MMKYMRDNPKPLMHGEIHEIAIEIIPTGHLFRVGQKICLKIYVAIDEAPKIGT